MRNLIKKILKESEEFDWVDTGLTNLRGQRLYDTIQHFFSTYNDRYWLEEENGHITIWDDTGIYYDYNMEDFNIENMVQDFKNSMANIGNDEVREDYFQLAKTLEPIIGPISKNINESEEEFGWLPDQSEIGLKVRVNGKPFYIKDYIHKQDMGFFTSTVSGWGDCYEIVGEKVLRGVDCYIIKIHEGYPEVYFPKKSFKEKDFCRLNESEEELNWVGDLDKEPFHYQLIKQDKFNRKGHPPDIEDVRYIMFNPAVEVGDKRFNKIAYFLEDNDYYPESLEPFGKKTSYIKITRFRDMRQNGRWDIGPELSEQELYNFSQENFPHHGISKYWAEEFILIIPRYYH